MISILMATYNGEKYIKEQLDSLLQQTYQNFVIFINDDCSTDKTFDILKEYQTKYPHKLKLSQSSKNSGNAKYNFLNLMIHVKDKYVMLCDQDDIWIPEKIELSLKKMKQMEEKYGKDIPILVHSDLQVVDEELHMISKSYADYININFNKISLNKQVIQNTLTGCTAMYNLALANLITKEPTYLIMHDWYLMLVASAFGKIGTVAKSTVWYRQHSNNVVGSINMKSLYTIWKIFKNKKLTQEAIKITYLQAKAFNKQYADLLTDEQKQFLINYAMIPKQNKFKRILMIFQLKTFKNGIMRNIGYFIFI